MPDRYQDSPISMDNGTFEFDTLEEVKQLPRASFPEFTIWGRHGWFRFHIDAEWAYVESQHDDPATRAAIDDIVQVLDRRRAQVVSWLCRQSVLKVWFVPHLVTTWGAHSGHIRDGNVAAGGGGVGPKAG